MDFQMVEEIKVETKMFKFIDLISVFIIVGFLLGGFLLSDNVHSALKVPFIIFNGVVGMVISIKSPWNKDMKIWKSILLFFKNLISIKRNYHAVEFEEHERYAIEENKQMYNPKYLKSQKE